MITGHADLVPNSYFHFVKTLSFNMYVKYKSIVAHSHCSLIIFSTYRRDDSWFAALGRSCIHMTWGDRGAISLDVRCILRTSAVWQSAFFFLFSFK